MRPFLTEWRSRRAGVSPENLDPAAFHEYLVNAILIAGTLGIITFCCCAFTVVYEVNAIRIAQNQAIADTQRGVFSRMDSLLWKLDTFLITFSATNQSLAKGLMQVRVQVKESQDAQTQSTKEIGKVAALVAKESLKATENAVQAVVDAPKPVVEVKPQPPTVRVETPPPVPQPRKEERAQPPPLPTADPKPKRRWYRRVWPW